MVSATAVVKAITSCFTVLSISWMRSTSKPACARSRRAASAGTTPSCARASEAASSTSSHCWNLFRSLQIRPISGRVYRGIMVILELKNFTRSMGRGNRETRLQTAPLQGFDGHHLHDRRVIVLLAQVAQYQIRGSGIQILDQVIRHMPIRKVTHAAHHTLLDAPGIGPHFEHVPIRS